MVFINTTDVLGVIIATGTETTTGSLFISLLIFILFLMSVCVLFGVPLEFSVIIVLPLLLGCMSYYGDFIAIGTTFLIYLALIFTQKFIFR